MQAWFESFKEEFILNFVTKDRYMYIVKGLSHSRSRSSP